MKILISIDPTKNGQAVAKCWGLFPLPNETDIYLLQVIEVGTTQQESDHSLVWKRTLSIARTVWVKEATVFLEKVRKFFADRPENKQHVLTAEGSPPDEILRILLSHRIDLVALGNRGLSGIKRFLLGSTSDRVLQEGPCSVVIFRNKAKYSTKSNITKHFKILIAFEGPTDGLLSYEVLQSLNFLGSTSIAVVQVVAQPTFMNTWIFTKISPQLLKMGEDLMRKAQRVGQKHVREITQKLKMNGIKAKPVFVTGNPADEILKVERRVKPDLIVLGAQGWNGGLSMPLGGVAKKVARYATCSVLVARPGRVGTKVDPFLDS